MTGTIDRRSASTHNESGVRFDAPIITKSLIVQQLTGTMSAIEYLKTNGVSGAIIERVLSGYQVRRGDAEALAELHPLPA